MKTLVMNSLVVIAKVATRLSVGQWLILFRSIGSGGPRFSSNVPVIYLWMIFGVALTPWMANSQTTSVLFQGRLDGASLPPDGLYDVQLQLFDSAQGGAPVSDSLVAVGAPITNNSFAIVADFGSGAFPGAERWLQIGYRSNSLLGDFQLNSSRMRITSSPYAIKALNATSVSGPVAASSVSGILSDSSLSTNVAMLTRDQTFSGSNVFSGVSILTNANNLLAGTFSGNWAGGSLSGNGGGVTNLNGTNVVVGTIPARAIAGGQVVKAVNGLADSVALVAGTNVSINVAGNTLTIAAIAGPVGPSWGLSGNSGTAPWGFIGTTDLQPLEIRVNGARALRIEPAGAGEVNLLGGLSGNAVLPGVVSAVIAGGGDAGSGGTNFIASSYSAIGGGRRNVIGTGAADALIGGGRQNSVAGSQALVAGGYANVIGSNSTASAIGGGAGNVIQPNSGYAVINGGLANTNSAAYGTIVGGAYNSVQAGSSQAAVIGGYLNVVQAGVRNSAIVAGANNTVSNAAAYSVIVGGYQNAIGTDAQMATIGGGRNNAVLAAQAHIGGGAYGGIGSNSFGAVIGGGANNTVAANAAYTAIGGGAGNLIRSGSQYSSVAGGVQNSVQQNSPAATILNGYSNMIGSNAVYGVIAGGAYNSVSDNATYGVVLGGSQNTAGAPNSLASGSRAKANHSGSYVWADTTAADMATTGAKQYLIRANGGVGIGTNAPKSALHVSGTVTADGFSGNGSGLSNVLAGSLTGTVPDSCLSGNIPLLNSAPTFTGIITAPGFAGSGAALSSLNAANLSSGTLPDARLSTNVVLVGNIPNVALLDSSPTFSGPVTAPAFNYTSDRNAKRDLAPIDAQRIADKIAAMPIGQWVYRSDPSVKHVGPMAQDFFEAFGLGADDKHISAVDANGIALAAIQGLVTGLRAKEAEVRDLRQRIERLEALIQGANKAQ